MGKRFAQIALAAALSAGAGAALAQTIPEGQSCGGLLCDMGVFGHKTEPKPAETKVETPVAASAAARAAPVKPEPRRLAHARARPAKVAARPPAPRPKIARVEARPATTVAPAVAAPSLMAPASMTMPPSRAAPPPPPPPVVIINPYSSMGVSATQFQPVDPRY